MKQHSITALHGLRYCFFMTHDLPVPSSVPVGRYRNFKGDGHKVIGVVRHSESRKPMALHRPVSALVASYLNDAREEVSAGKARQAGGAV